MEKKLVKMFSTALMAIGSLSSLILVASALVLPQVTQGPADTGLYIVGAGLAAGLACCGAGIGMGTASAAAIGTVAEKPEMFSITFIYIVFIEAIAIYGLVIAFMILGRI